MRKRARDKHRQSSRRGREIEPIPSARSLRLTSRRCGPRRLASLAPHLRRSLEISSSRNHRHRQAVSHPSSSAHLLQRPRYRYHVHHARSLVRNSETSISLACANHHYLACVNACFLEVYVRKVYRRAILKSWAVLSSRGAQACNTAWRRAEIESGATRRHRAGGSYYNSANSQSRQSSSAAASKMAPNMRA